MTSLTKRIGLGGLATLGVVALLTGCGQAPTAAPSGGGSSAAATSDYLSCIVSDQGGFDDRSFNQLGLEGVQAAAKSIGGEVRQVQSASENDYESNVENLVNQDCNIIVASGFLLVDAMSAAAKANPDTSFAMIDSQIDAPNVKNVVFDTNEAAFLAGYAAAAYSKSGVIGTFGGLEIPTVTIFMDGVARGVDYFNEQKDADVRLLGWDVDKQNGTFVGSFTDQNRASTITTNFLDQDADVIIPVAGGLYQAAGASIKDSDSDAVLVGVDADVYETDTTDLQDILLVSILKNIATAAEDVVTQSAGDEDFDNTQYVGDLENDGVGLSSFHDFESKVPDTLQGELDDIKAGIIDGSISADSPSAFEK